MTKHNIITYRLQCEFDDGKSFDSVWIRESTAGILTVELGRNDMEFATGDDVAGTAVNKYGDLTAITCDDLAKIVTAHGIQAAVCGIDMDDDLDREPGGKIMIYTRPEPIIFDMPGTMEQAEQLIHDVATLGDALDWYRFGRSGNYRWLTKPEAWNINKAGGSPLSWRRDPKYAERLNQPIAINIYRTRGIRHSMQGGPCKITGNTYNYRQLLRRAGCWRDPVAKVWRHHDINKIISATARCRGLIITADEE